MNYKPTVRNVRAKLNADGFKSLFAWDEVYVLFEEIDRLNRQVADYREHNRELVEKYVGTGRA